MGRRRRGDRLLRYPTQAALVRASAIISVGAAIGVAMLVADTEVAVTVNRLGVGSVLNDVQPQRASLEWPTASGFSLRRDGRPRPDALASSA